MNIKNSFNKYNKIEQIVLLLLLFFFFLSVILYFVMQKDNRYVFLYESMDNNSIYTEEHWISNVSSSLPLEQRIIEELILGPKTDRYKSLFQFGTEVLSCYRNKNTLVINLSDKAAVQRGKASSTENAYTLMNKNIKRLIKDIENITFFIAGQKITQENFVK